MTMTKKEQKHAAQDLLLGWMVEAIERKRQAGDIDMEQAMRREAQRVMRLFGVDFFPGL